MVRIDVGDGSALTAEKIDVSEGPVCGSGVAVMVDIMAVEETVNIARCILSAANLGLFFSTVVCESQSISLSVPANQIQAKHYS